MNSPLVSIIIPIYNAEKFLNTTIESVLNQTYKNWELLLINDGSTDNSTQIVQQYANHSQIKIYNQPNRGVSAARNLGLSEAKGEFIALLDADDYWLPENLEIKINYLTSNPTTDFVFSNMTVSDANLVPTGITEIGNDKDMLVNYLKWEKPVLPGLSSNLVFKTICCSKATFDTQLSTAADQDFCIQLLSYFKGKHIDKNTWLYRVLPNSMSKNIGTFEKDHLYVFNKALKNNLFYSKHFKKKCFSNVYLIIAGSWWVYAKNKKRALYFILRAIYEYPAVIILLINKFLKGPKTLTSQ